MAKFTDSLPLTNQKPHFSEDQKSAHILAVCSQKGGVGKTTTSVNLATSLALHQNKNVLLIDLDPQGHVEKSLSGLIEEGLEYSPLSELFRAKKGDILDCLVKTTHHNLQITPGDSDLYQTEGLITSRLAREFILKRALKKAIQEYDVIVIDCPPNLGNLTINALCCAHSVLIPCEMSVLGFEGVTDLLETVETINETYNEDLNVLGVVYTRVDERNAQINKLVRQNISKIFNGQVFKSEIKINTDLTKAQLEGLSVFDYKASSPGAKYYKKLGDEVSQKIF